MVVAFDLDDTLVPERRFLESAVVELGRRHSVRQRLLPSETFAEYLDYVGINVSTLIEEYRSHSPQWLPLPWQSVYTLETLKKRGANLYLVTDGRSHSQRAKINALRLSRWFPPENIYISEEVGESKTTGRTFREIAARHLGEQLWMIGDNPEKDFLAAAREGFKTVCLLDSGTNIHPQSLDDYEHEYHSQFLVRNLTELPDLML